MREQRAEEEGVWGQAASPPTPVLREDHAGGGLTPGELSLLVGRRPPLRRRAALRLRDLALAPLLTALLAPLLIGIAVAVAVTSGRPVFYTDERVGMNGRTFGIWKFRTMHPDAHTRRIDLGAVKDADGPRFKVRDDPRLTAIGRLLRRWSLDELPQIAQVVTGQLSLVGPRPMPPDEVVQYDARCVQRLTVRPGVTGLWQVEGRSDLSFDEAIRLDLRYVAEQSLRLDFRILARTPGAVISGRGAY